MAEAAEILGTSVEGVRGRIKRGTLEGVKDGGTVYVLLPPDQSTDQARPADDQVGDQSRPDVVRSVVDELRDRIAYLERQVEEEREARRRADTILAQLSQANAEQARTIRAIEAPAAEPTGPPETGADEQQGRGPVPDAGGPQEPADPRSWWRRVFGEWGRTIGPPNPRGPGRCVPICRRQGGPGYYGAPGVTAMIAIVVVVSWVLVIILITQVAR